MSAEVPPPPATLRRDTLVRLGIVEGDLFAYYGTFPNGPRTGRLVRWRRRPTDPRSFDMIDEQTGHSLWMGYATKMWATKV